MKLNYYLRGLGIGIVVTALLMGITGKSSPMTDEQIKNRARELGMIDSGEQVLSENSQLSDKDEAVATIVLGETPENGTTKPEDALEALTENITKGDKATSSSSDKKETSSSDKKEMSSSDKKETSSSDKKETSSSSEKKETSSSVKKEASSSAKLPEVGTKADESEDGQAPDKAKQSSSVKTSSSAKNSSSAKSSSSAKDSSSAKSSSSAKDSSSAKSSSSTKEEKLAAATEDAKNRAEAQAYTLTVSGGQGSASVAKELERAGIIADADAFDKFLCANGYDRRITVGKKVIPAGASEVEIAGILTVK